MPGERFGLHAEALGPASLSSIVRPHSHAMKIIIALTVGLLIGAGVGWYAGYTRPLTKSNRDARRYLTTMEVDDSTAAIFAVRAIPIVESGDTQKAVQWLAKPIGSYYRVYETKAGTNAERLSLRAKIEQLASTNSVVAAEIHRKIE